MSRAGICNHLGITSTSDAVANEKPWISERCPCFAEILKCREIYGWCLDGLLDCYGIFSLSSCTMWSRVAIYSCVHKCIWISGITQKIWFVLVCDLEKKIQPAIVNEKGWVLSIRGLLCFQVVLSLVDFYGPPFGLLSPSGLPAVIAGNLTLWGITVCEHVLCDKVWNRKYRWIFKGNGKGNFVQCFMHFSFIGSLAFGLKRHLPWPSDPLAPMILMCLISIFFISCSNDVWLPLTLY